MSQLEKDVGNYIFINILRECLGLCPIPGRSAKTTTEPKECTSSEHKFGTFLYLDLTIEEDLEIEFEQLHFEVIHKRKI